jgi:hypothetical protein
MTQPPPTPKPIVTDAEWLASLDVGYVVATKAAARLKRIAAQLTSPNPEASEIMREALVKHMAERFLGWRLPDDFHPDGGVSFCPVGNKGTAHEYRHNPVGTNLFDYTQAEAMVRHMLEGFEGEQP